MYIYNGQRHRDARKVDSYPLTYVKVKQLTMHCAKLNITTLAMLAAGASAATHKVEVGKGGLNYTPDTIKADKGDIIEFHFDSMHTVVAGDFNKPCTPVASGGFYSGIMPTGSKVGQYLASYSGSN